MPKPESLADHLPKVNPNWQVEVERRCHLELVVKNSGYTASDWFIFKDGVSGDLGEGSLDEFEHLKTEDALVGYILSIPKFRFLISVLEAENPNWRKIIEERCGVTVTFDENEGAGCWTFKSEFGEETVGNSDLDGIESINDLIEYLNDTDIVDPDYGGFRKSDLIDPIGNMVESLSYVYPGGTPMEFCYSGIWGDYVQVGNGGFT